MAEYLITTTDERETVLQKESVRIGKTPLETLQHTADNWLDAKIVEQREQSKADLASLNPDAMRLAEAVKDRTKEEIDQVIAGLPVKG